MRRQIIRTKPHVAEPDPQKDAFIARIMDTLSSSPLKGAEGRKYIKIAESDVDALVAAGEGL